MKKKQRKNKNKKTVFQLYPKKIALILIIPSLAIYLFFMIWPIVYSIYIAFTDASALNIAPSPDKIQDLKNAKACVLQTYEAKEEIGSKAHEAYVRLKHARDRLELIYEDLMNKLKANETIQTSYIASLLDDVVEAENNISIATEYIKGLFQCNTTYTILDPYISQNLSSALDEFGYRVKSPLQEMALSLFTEEVDKAKVRSVVVSLNSTITKLDLVLISIQDIGEDFEGFLDRVLKSIDYELYRLELHFVGLKNLDEILHDSRFIYSIYKTLLFVVTSVPLKVSVGVFLAFFFSTPMIYGRKAWRALLLTPWAIPILLSVTTWRILFTPGQGPLAKALDPFVPGGSFSITGNEWHAFFVYNIVEMWLAYPFIMTVTMGAIASIPRELIEAAYIDGASVWLRFRKIMLPQVIRPILFATVLTTGASLQAFMVPLLINGGGPEGMIRIPGLDPRMGNKNEFMVLFGYNRAYIDKEYGYAAAAYLILVVFLAIYILLWLRITRMGKR